MENDTIDTSKILVFNEPDDDYNGLAGVTKQITQQRLYSAYMQGIFPWFCEDNDEPVLWYSPNPRFCLKIEDLHIPKSVDKFLKKTPYDYTFDKDFSAVIHGCRDMEREGQDGTWIGKKIIDAYEKFHENGYAHSVEVWHSGKLAGGLYGVLIGSVFFGESMFTIESDSAKSAFAIFARTFRDCGGKLIDSQVYTSNIARYGAAEILRDEFLFFEQHYLPLPLIYDVKSLFQLNVESLKSTGKFFDKSSIESGEFESSGGILQILQIPPDLQTIPF